MIAKKSNLIRDELLPFPDPEDADDVWVVRMDGLYPVFEIFYLREDAAGFCRDRKIGLSFLKKQRIR